MEEPILLTVFTDPMMGLSYESEPILDALAEHYHVNFFVSGYIDTVYEWLLREDRTPEQIAGFLLDMMKQFMP